jgi:phage tail sheath protein FI
MPSYSTPGVYIQEVSVFPPSIAPVATAIPAFIGTTQRGEDLLRKAVRITSLLEYEALYGAGPVPKVAVKVEEHFDRLGNVTQLLISWDKKPDIPDRFLYPSLRLYFANGGGPCYIYSIGDYGAAPKAQDFADAIAALEAEDEPTLLVFPDAVKLERSSTPRSPAATR